MVPGIYRIPLAPRMDSLDFPHGKWLGDMLLSGASIPSPSIADWIIQFLHTFRIITDDIGYILVKKDALVKSFHAIVSFVVIISIISVIIGLNNPKIDWNSDEYVSHHFQKNITWLFSIWCAVVQVIYFNLHFVIDIFDICSKQNRNIILLINRLRLISSYLLFAFVFPVSSLESILFWTFYWIKKEAFYAEIANEIIHPLVNHICHTLPPIFSVVFMFTSNGNEPPKSKALVGLLGFLFIYVTVIVNIKMRDGKWVYLVLETLTPIQLKCLFIFSITGSVYFLHLGYYINYKIKVYRKVIMDLLK